MSDGKIIEHICGTCGKLTHCTEEEEKSGKSDCIRNFGEVEDEEIVPVCEDCYNKFWEWAQNKRPELVRRDDEKLN